MGVRKSQIRMAARRKELNGIVRDFATHFSSRNKDYDGYWALGQLRSIAKLNQIEALKLDVVSKNGGMSLEPYERKYWECLVGKLKNIGGSSTWVKSALIELEFSFSHPRNYIYWSEVLAKCTVLITIETDLGRTYSAQSHCFCVSHNPEKEQRRVRF